MARTVCYCRRCGANTVHSVSEPRQLPEPFTLAAPVVQMCSRRAFFRPCACHAWMNDFRKCAGFPFSSPRAD